MPSNPPGIELPGLNLPDNSLPSSSANPSVAESNRADPAGHAADSTRTAYENWVHEFRNALGNVTIAASAAKSELAAHPELQASALMRQIEDGCDRCLRLLRTMPR